MEKTWKKICKYQSAGVECSEYAKPKSSYCCDEHMERAAIRKFGTWQENKELDSQEWQEYRDYVDECNDRFHNQYIA